MTETLLGRYHRPYHQDLDRLAENIIVGIDCHTMAAVGPPVGPDPGEERPFVCLGNGDGTCPHEWLVSLAEIMKKNLKAPVAINTPFKGGYIIRHHAGKIAWFQMELSRAPFLNNMEKSELILESLKAWHHCFC